MAESYFSHVFVRYTGQPVFIIARDISTKTHLQIKCCRSMFHNKRILFRYPLALTGSRWGDIQTTDYNINKII